MSTQHLNSNSYDDLQNQDQLDQGWASVSPGAAVAGAAAAAVMGAGGAGGMASAALGGAVTTDSVTSEGSGLVFNNTFGSGASSIMSQIVTAEQDLQALASNSATLNETFQAVNQGENGDLADNSFYTINYSFSQLKAALAAHELTAVGADAVASLTTDVSGGMGYNLPEGYAAMLGLYTGTVAQDTVTLNTYYLDPNDSSNNQSIINAITHEISEGGMGRIGGLGWSSKGNGTGGWSTMDLFSFNASGQRDLSTSDTARYFSYNDGATTSQGAGLAFFAADSGNDAADFNAADVFGYGFAGETYGLSQTDLQIMEALGWNPVNPGILPGQLPTYVNDFNGDGIGDILWTNGSQLGVWTEDANLNPTWTLISPNTNGWFVVGTGDYDGGGSNNILWQNGQELGIWTESGNLTPTWTLLSSNLNGWSVVGGGDYNGAIDNRGGGGLGRGDEISDILFQNGNELGVWIENTNLNPTWELLSPNLNGWSVVGSGDYNGDGISDILFANGNELGVWTESTNLSPTWHLLSPNTNGWSVVGSGDYTGSGVSDILWSNGSELGIWLENSSLNPTWEVLSPNTNGWFVVGSADYNGAVSSSGHQISDILWSNGSQLGVWIENGSLNPTWHLLSGSTNGWIVTGAGSPGIH